MEIDTIRKRWINSLLKNDMTLEENQHTHRTYRNTYVILYVSNNLRNQNMMCRRATTREREGTISRRSLGPVSDRK